MNKRIPNHIVLFPDGNRRWADKKNWPAIKGHQQGYQKFEDFLNWCQEKGVKVLTVFGFSTENWKRSKKEVDYLMKLFENALSKKDKIEKFQKARVRVRIIGEKNKLSKSLQKVIANIEKVTKNNSDFYLNLAVSYGGRWDIVQAIKKIIRKKIPVKDINEELVGSLLSTAGLPAPDLIIRAGGEKRFSNFVLWQAAYSELHFSSKLWPDFSEKDFKKAVNDYALRQRRFGGDNKKHGKRG
ncbi:MAG: polyprenyl diphosphate synthase [Patescibacteria group bacterium]|nr:di-trans,poly-cis-decaprenylcistransferase [Patescibacteria group bacterium]MBU1876786.1 di-trans,poly-cis-decaprenylcistransferase [Patescibacteria group bacterium]